MDLPAVHLLLLEQGDRSLEDHMRDFLDLVCLTHYSLCKFLHTISTSGPRQACPWMFLWEISPLIWSGCLNASLILDPESSQPSTTPFTDLLPERTANPEPAPTMKPELKQPPKALFIPEPMLNMESDQVQVPTTLAVPVCVLMEYKWSPAYTPVSCAWF